jgi:hypothetical protein
LLTVLIDLLVLVSLRKRKKRIESRTSP